MVKQQIPTTASEATARTDLLHFRPLTTADIELIRPALMANSLRPRTCDFTVGGLAMWTDYFKYSFAIDPDGMLYINGLNEMDLSRQAFSLPCGAADLGGAIGRLRRHCTAAGIGRCEISAVPEPALEIIGRHAPIERVEQLEPWSDYLYEIEPMATFAGKKMAKKRNHLHRFMEGNPGWTLEAITPDNIAEVREFFERLHPAANKSVTADFERLQVLEVLRHPALFGFEGAALRIPGRGIVAFAMGEVIDDTLFTHIEKMDHDVEGAGETICNQFTALMARRHPALRFVNREEDAGDDGLRKAKLSYHPYAILQKFNVVLGV